MSQKNSDIFNFLDLLKEKIQESDSSPTVSEIGKIISVSDGIIKISGLTNCFLGEVIMFDNNIKGIALNLNYDSIDVIAFGKDEAFKPGMIAKRTEKPLSVPVGMQMLGRVIDPLGNPIDNLGSIACEEYYEIEREAPGILSRKSVHEPIQTGILAIDSMIPIGRGQRELIIGDRQTGKTTIAIDTIINQSKINKELKNNSDKVYSVYVAIGQKVSTIVELIQELKKHDAFDNSIIIASSSSDNVGMQYIAPYTGCAIGEYFRDNKMHSLVVYDDLTKHAVAYRQMSLLLKRPPSREAYPADVFYLHSRLLERAAKLSDSKGGGSLTALPIIETQAGDISAYIPTNVISITDGQIFLESELFLKGIRPAINTGLSVSRVGSAAQTKAMKSVSGNLRSELSQFNELAEFARFSSDLDSQTLSKLDHGKKTTELMIQPQSSPISLAMEVIILFLIKKNLLTNLNIENIKIFCKNVYDSISLKKPEIIDEINSYHLFSEKNQDFVFNLSNEMNEANL